MSSALHGMAAAVLALQTGCCCLERLGSWASWREQVLGKGTVDVYKGFWGAEKLGVLERLLQ